jgi:NAD-dependent histone deacetylase SIR2
MALPVTLPTEATPLDVSKKRKHEEIEHVLENHIIPTTATEESKTSETVDNPPTEDDPPTRNIEDSDEEDDDDKSIFEDILDHCEGQPYIDGKTTPNYHQSQN